MFRAAGGRGEEPPKSDTPICHPIVMLTLIMIADATRQHRIHDGMNFFLLRKVWEVGDEDVDEKDDDEHAIVD
jgi:hypothetical protein